MPDRSFSVEVDRRVEKDLASAPPHVVERFLRALARLAEEPLKRRPGFDILPLAGHPAVYRLRLGEWRVLYSVDQEARRVRVTSAAPRSRAYR